MPKVNISSAEVFRIEASSRIKYLMNLKGYDNEKCAKALGISARTYIQKKQCPGEFSVEQMMRLERFLGSEISTPFRLKEGVCG